MAQCALYTRTGVAPRPIEFALGDCEDSRNVTHVHVHGVYIVHVHVHEERLGNIFREP